MTVAVGKLDLDGISQTGDRFPVRLEIGAPYQRDTGEWACPLSLSLHEGLPDVRGEDSYQALCLAIRLAQTLLQGFIDDGGRLLVGGEPFPIEAYGFASPPIPPRPRPV